LQDFRQEISGKQLLEKAIHYHDPKGNWDHFQGKLSVKTYLMVLNGCEITIDLINQYFKLTTVKNDKQLSTLLMANPYLVSIVEEFTEEVKTFSLTAARAQLQNYYTYLYGLPMKLNQGTIISSVVNRKNFLGKEYLVLKSNTRRASGPIPGILFFEPLCFKNIPVLP
jgi:hypothetical protein